MLSAIAVVVLALIGGFLFVQARATKNLPPGPRGDPLIGAISYSSVVVSPCVLTDSNCFARQCEGATHFPPMVLLHRIEEEVWYALTQSMTYVLSLIVYHL